MKALLKFLEVLGLRQRFFLRGGAQQAPVERRRCMQPHLWPKQLSCAAHECTAPQAHINYLIDRSPEHKYRGVLFDGMSRLMTSLGGDVNFTSHINILMKELTELAYDRDIPVRAILSAPSCAGRWYQRCTASLYCVRPHA